MPRAGPSRSQRQPSQTQTHRYGRSQRRIEDENDDEEIVVGNYEDDDEPMEDTNTVRAAPIVYTSSFFGSSQLSLTPHEQDLRKRATDLVRLALFNEQKRMPLRRDEISKKVMGSQRGTFKTVFDEAQKILRATFGMELVELPTRAATHDTSGGGTSRGKAQEKAGTRKGAEEDDTAGGRQTVTGLRKKGIVP